MGTLRALSTAALALSLTTACDPLGVRLAAQSQPQTAAQDTVQNTTQAAPAQAPDGPQAEAQSPTATTMTPAAAFAAPPAPEAATQSGANTASAATVDAPAKKTYTVPAGTKVLLQLQSAINTKSARPGDGVYLTSSFPVVVGNHVMIPTGVYVQGVVDRVQRAGQMKGKAELDMHFTSMVFPNGSVVEIPGLVDALPGASKQKVKDGEGTIEQNPDKGRNVGDAAKIALPTGASAGTIAGAISGHPISGGLIGVGAGLAAMGLTALFTRGADVNIDKGTQVEMVLQRPLLLEEANLNTSADAPSLVPAPNQPRPLDKPRPDGPKADGSKTDKPGRAGVLCPPGSLGCE